MKIIVTGNSGFIAKHLIDGLQKRIDVDEIWGLGRSNTGDLYFQRLSCAKNKYTYNSETITRIRREIQSRGLYRPDLDIQKQRNLFEQELERKYNVSF